MRAPREPFPDERGPPVCCRVTPAQAVRGPIGLGPSVPRSEAHFLRSDGGLTARLTPNKSRSCKHRHSHGPGVRVARTLPLKHAVAHGLSHSHPLTAHPHAQAQPAHTHKFTLVVLHICTQSHNLVRTHLLSYIPLHAYESSYAQIHLLTCSHALAWLLDSQFCGTGDALSHLGTSRRKLLPAPLPRSQRLAESFRAQLQTCLPQEGSPVFPSLLGPPRKVDSSLYLCSCPAAHVC